MTGERPTGGQGRAPRREPGGWWWPVVAAVATRPHLWATAAVQVGRLAPPGWWRRWPPLPVPDPEWLRFRARTAYGNPDRRPEPADVVAWLEWCRDGT